MELLLTWWLNPWHRWFAVIEERVVADSLEFTSLIQPLPR